MNTTMAVSREAALGAPQTLLGDSSISSSRLQLAPAVAAALGRRRRGATTTHSAGPPSRGGMFPQGRLWGKDGPTVLPWRRLLEHGGATVVRWSSAGSRGGRQRRCAGRESGTRRPPFRRGGDDCRPLRYGARQRIPLPAGLDEGGERRARSRPPRAQSGLSWLRCGGSCLEMVGGYSPSGLEVVDGLWLLTVWFPAGRVGAARSA
jgi:hypothetical protein